MTEPASRRTRPLLRPTGAADVLSIYRTTLYGLLRSGALRAVKVGGLRRIPYEALEEIVGRLEADQEADAGAPWSDHAEGERSVGRRAGQPAGAGRLAHSDRTTSPSDHVLLSSGFDASSTLGHGTVAP